MNKRFLVLCKPTGGVREFDTAKEVSIYMWGRTVAFYSIYIITPMLPLPTDVSELEDRLKDCEDQIHENISTR